MGVEKKAGARVCSPTYQMGRRPQPTTAKWATRWGRAQACDGVVATQGVGLPDDQAVESVSLLSGEY